MSKGIVALLLAAAILVGMAGAANYMYEKASIKGVGYKNVEMIISTQTGFEGQKLVEKESGSGNVITERTELEAERQLQRGGGEIPGNCIWPTGIAVWSLVAVASGLDLGGLLQVLSMGVHLCQHCADLVVLHAEFLDPLLVIGAGLV